MHRVFGLTKKMSEMVFGMRQQKDGEAAVTARRNGAICNFRNFANLGFQFGTASKSGIVLPVNVYANKPGMFEGIISLPTIRTDCRNYSAWQTGF